MKIYKKVKKDPRTNEQTQTSGGKHRAKTWMTTCVLPEIDLLFLYWFKARALASYRDDLVHKDLEYILVRK